MRVELPAGERADELMQREADVALSRDFESSAELIGRAIGDVRWALYAGRRYLERRPPPSRAHELEQHDFVGLHAERAAMAWLMRAAPGARAVARHGTVVGQVPSAKAGIGLALLPTNVGDAEPELVRVLRPIDELDCRLRPLVSPYRRFVPRVAALFDVLVSVAGEMPGRSTSAAARATSVGSSKRVG